MILAVNLITEFLMKIFILTLTVLFAGQVFSAEVSSKIVLTEIVEVTHELASDKRDNVSQVVRIVGSGPIEYFGIDSGDKAGQTGSSLKAGVELSLIAANSYELGKIGKEISNCASIARTAKLNPSIVLAIKSSALWHDSHVKELLRDKYPHIKLQLRLEDAVFSCGKSRPRA